MTEGGESVSPDKDARVTIVVPTYRRPAYLAQCLASIRAQTYSDFVVAVYDNSPDREGQDVVAAMADDRFCYVPRPRDLGMFANAVQGLAAASTELVMEVDDDDLLLPECLATLVPAFHDPMDVSISFGGAHVIDELGRRMSLEEGVRFIPHGDVPVGFTRPFGRLAAAGFIFLNTSIVRHSAVDWKGIPEQAGSAYDRHIALAAARNGRAVFHTPTPVIEYRVHSSSDSLVNSSQQHYAALFVLSLERQHAPLEERVWIDAEMLRTRLFLAKSLQEAGDSRCAWKQLASGLVRPEAPRALWSLGRTYGQAHARRMAARVTGRVRKPLHRPGPEGSAP